MKCGGPAGRQVRQSILDGPAAGQKRAEANSLQPLNDARVLAQTVQDGFKGNEPHIEALLDNAVDPLQRGIIVAQGGMDARTRSVDLCLQLLLVDDPWSEGAE